jgi:hypothetical protein
MTVNQCFRCQSKRCHYRIYLRAGDFDEVACRVHKLELEQKADQVIEKDATRIHVIGNFLKRLK